MSVSLKGHAFLALILLGALTQDAKAEDYTEHAESWNGLGYLKQTALEAKVNLSLADEVDWDRVKPDQNLLILYPQEALPIQEILKFVSDGGDLVIADDFGKSDALLEALGIKKVRPALEVHQSFYDGNTAFPTLTPSRESFLFYNVESITANHPMAFTGEAKPILSFDENQHLIMEKSIGSGRVLLIADPSLLLNDMLRRIYGNKQFAANILRVFCDNEPCAVTAISPTAIHSGHYRSRSSPISRMAILFDEAGMHIDVLLKELDALLKTWPGQGVLLWGLFFASFLGVATILATGRVRPKGPPKDQAPRLSPQAIQALGLAGAHAEADFGIYAKHLVNEVDYALLGSGPTGIRRVEEGAEVHDALLRFQKERSSLSSIAPPVIGAERFLRLYHDAQTILRTLSRTRAK